MPHVEASIRIHKNPDALWNEIGSFQSVGAWHTMLSHVDGDGEKPGSLRIATGKDGSKQVERLEQVDKSNLFYRYQMLSSAMPVTDYTAEFRVRGDEDNGSVVVWSSDFHVTAGDGETTEASVRQFFDVGLDNLRKKLDPETK
jgi:mxaD protein